MSLALLSILAFAAEAPPPAMADQTADALLVLRFVEAVRRGADSEARSMLAPNAFLGDVRRKPAPYSEFAAYARACRLREVRLVNTRDGKRMPVGVSWQCPKLAADRLASFWFEGDRIVRVAWGPATVVRMPVVIPKPQAK